mmetsp:Transcript_10492/g.32603  ORF Transcript_10492/g.32603 Transcript_10492/m.32603 type:complete len:303 (+) Transcript_10492:3-911(+)
MGPPSPPAAADPPAQRATVRRPASLPASPGPPGRRRPSKGGPGAQPPRAARRPWPAARPAPRARQAGALASGRHAACRQRAAGRCLSGAVARRSHTGRTTNAPCGPAGRCAGLHLWDGRLFWWARCLFCRRCERNAPCGSAGEWARCLLSNRACEAAAAAARGQAAGSQATAAPQALPLGGASGPAPGTLQRRASGWPRRRGAAPGPPCRAAFAGRPGRRSCHRGRQDLRSRLLSERSAQAAVSAPGGRRQGRGLAFPTLAWSVGVRARVLSCRSPQTAVRGWFRRHRMPAAAEWPGGQPSS